MKNLFKPLLLFLTLNGIIYGKITGIVTDQNSGKPLINVEITIVKTNIGTTSNELGEFEIEYDHQKLELAFNHIAYQSKYVTLNNVDTSLSITLKETLLQMEDIVVTSMRSGYLLRDVPVSTEVIGKKEIIASGAITIDELLNQRAGVSSTVNVDGGSIFNLQGLDSRYILILKDGQPITGRFNNRVDLSQISINRIEKVEITTNDGGSWQVANILKDDEENNSNTMKIAKNHQKMSINHAWVRFEADVTIPVSTPDSKKIYIHSRATDSNGLIQPKYSPKQRGYLYNGWGKTSLKL